MALDFGKLDFSVSFNRTSAFPLDAKSYFESLTSAQAAAKTAEAAGSSNTVYYYGQTIAVVEGGVATLYTIQPDKTLAEVGGSISFNENVFATGSDGKLDLYGFADAVSGAQLLKGVDGKLSWVKPDTTTVEGLQTAVEAIEEALGDKAEGTGLAGDIKDLEDLVGTPASEEPAQAATGIFAQLDEKADKDTVYTKTETDDKISAAIAAADHLSRKIVASTGEIDLEAPDADKYIYMVPATGSEANDTYDEYMVISGALEKVGSWEVDLSDYVTSETLTTELNKKVDKVAGSRLMTDAEGTKLAGIEAGAQVNFIKTVDEAQFAATGGNLTLLDIAQSKVTGLTAALDKKVDKVDGSRLITTEEANKLAGLTLGEENQVTIPADNVTGLDALLENKVDKEDGKGLSANDFTDDLLSKLNGIAAGANANVIEAITINDVDLPVLDKKVDIPAATAESLGLVKSSTAENKVSVDASGVMEVNSLNVNKLAQTAGDSLIINGGTSTT